MIKIIKLITIFLPLFFLGCDSSTYQVETQENITTTQKDISGLIVDGYISDSSICIDTNFDNLCDENQTTIRSDKNGKFTFTTKDTNTTNIISFISYGGKNNSTQTTFLDQLKTVVDTSKDIPSLTISPLTDLVAVYFLNDTTHDSFTLNDAQSVVSDSLNISTLDIYKDPMTNWDIFKKSQEIQYTKHILETAFEKLVNLDKTLLKEKIKYELLNYSFNIEQILIAMEINLRKTLSDDEKEFIKNKISNMKTSLANLNSDITSDIDNFPKIEQKIYDDEKSTKQNIIDGDINTSLSLLPIDLNVPQYKAIFDETNAVLDVNACSTTNGFNILSNNAFEIGVNSDTRNGIDIKSQYAMGTEISDSQVTIFYPSLENAKIENSSVTIFEEDYYFAFNKAYIQNTHNIVYVEVPQNENNISSCYRYELNSALVSELDGVKVFR